MKRLLPESLNKASVAFGRLRGNVWDENGIRLDTKLKVYKAVVLPIFLYTCETWTVYQRHVKRLNHFHICCLRKLLKLRWQDKIPDTEVLNTAGCNECIVYWSLYSLDVMAMSEKTPDERLPKKVFYGELQVGKCSQGGQKKCYKDTLKAPLTESWEQIALNRTKWRCLIRKRADNYEAKRFTHFKIIILVVLFSLNQVNWRLL